MHRYKEIDITYSYLYGQWKQKRWEWRDWCELEKKIIESGGLFQPWMGRMWLNLEEIRHK